MIATAFTLDPPKSIPIAYSIGPEFSAGDIHGTLSGTGDDATVATLWAGASCIFR